MTNDAGLPIPKCPVDFRTENTKGNVTDVFAHLVDSGGLERSDLLGCAAQEVEVVRTHFRHRLPRSYKDFLEVAGRGAGRLFHGSDIYYPALLRLQSVADELLIENEENALPDSAMVIFMHQGYEFYYILPEEEDPPVFQYVEGVKGTSRRWKTFSDFLNESIETHLKVWPSLKRDNAE